MTDENEIIKAMELGKKRAVARKAQERKEKPLILLRGISEELKRDEGKYGEGGYRCYSDAAKLPSCDCSIYVQEFKTEQEAIAQAYLDEDVIRPTKDRKTIFLNRDSETGNLENSLNQRNPQVIVLEEEHGAGHHVPSDDYKLPMGNARENPDKEYVLYSVYKVPHEGLNRKITQIISTIGAREMEINPHHYQIYLATELDLKKMIRKYEKMLIETKVKEILDK